MTTTATATFESGTRSAAAVAPERRRLTFDLDVDVCVVGAGLAGLTVALEAARMGASVAVLESRHVGAAASGRQFGTVMPGFGVPVEELVDRVGVDHARELWQLSVQGADYVRAAVGDPAMGNLALTDGALQVSNVDRGGRFADDVARLRDDLRADVEGWETGRVRDVLRTDRYFQALHYPSAFQIDGSGYLHGLAALARQVGVRVFEETPVVGIDASGIRKRIVTPLARMRAAHVVLAGNVCLGDPSRRLTGTLLPVWRYAAITEPLDERLSEVLDFHGSVIDSDGIDHYRRLHDGRLIWASPETTWPANPQRFGAAIRRRIRAIYPGLGRVPLAELWGGPIGQTVHGMPQIGQLRPGLWVASGFGRQGLNTSALAGQLITRGMFWGDDRWRLFAPFELVWAGGRAGLVVGHAVGLWLRGSAAMRGSLSRWRERSSARRRVRESRLAAANLKAGTSLRHENGEALVSSRESD